MNGSSAIDKSQLTPQTVQPSNQSSPVPADSMNPLLSVLIVNYNYGHFLPEAIESILNQTYRNFELIICDDGSEDDSPEIIGSYAQRYPDHIRFILKENGGVASSLNAAHQESKGDIISLLDADDIFAETKLQRVVEEFVSKPEIGLVVNRMLKIGPDGAISGLIPQFGDLDSGWIREKLLRSGGHWSFAPASGMSLRRPCADEVFPIPEDKFRSEADSYIYTQVPMGWAVGAIKEPLSYYRLHTSNLTSSDRITPAYAERVLSGIERMCTALDATAVQNALPRPSIRDNPVYTEMTFIRDYLDGAGRDKIIGDLAQTYRAAVRCTSSDRSRVLVKPLLLTAISLLPRRVGARILQTIYLPSPWRRAMARQLLKYGQRQSSHSSKRSHLNFKV